MNIADRAGQRLLFLIEKWRVRLEPLRISINCASLILPLLKAAAPDGIKYAKDKVIEFKFKERDDRCPLTR